MEVLLRKSIESSNSSIDQSLRPVKQNTEMSEDVNYIIKSLFENHSYQSVALKICKLIDGYILGFEDKRTNNKNVRKIVYDVLCYISSILLKNYKIMGDGDRIKYRTRIQDMLAFSLNHLVLAIDLGKKNAIEDYLHVLHIICFLYNNFLFFETKMDCKVTDNPVALILSKFDVKKLDNIKKYLIECTHADGQIIFNDLLNRIGLGFEEIYINQTKFLLSGWEQESLIDVFKSYFIECTHFLAENYVYVLTNTLNGMQIDLETRFNLIRKALVSFNTYFKHVSKYGDSEELQRVYNFLMAVCGNPEMKKFEVAVKDEFFKYDKRDLLIKDDVRKLIQRVLILYFVKKALNEIISAFNLVEMKEKLAKTIKNIHESKRIRKSFEKLTTADCIIKYIKSITDNMGNLSVAKQNLNSIFTRNVFDLLKPSLHEVLNFLCDLKSKHTINNDSIRISDLDNIKQQEIYNRRDLLASIYEVFTFIASLDLSKVEFDFDKVYLEKFILDNMLNDLYNLLKSDKVLVGRYLLALNMVCHLYMNILKRIEMPDSKIAYSKEFLAAIFQAFGTNKLTFIADQLLAFEDIDAYLIYHFILDFFKLPGHDRKINDDAFMRVKYFEKASNNNNVLDRFYLHGTHFAAKYYLNVIERLGKNFIINLAVASEETLKGFEDLVDLGNEEEITLLYKLIARTSIYSGMVEGKNLTTKKEVCMRFFHKIRIMRNERPANILDAVRILVRYYDSCKESKIENNLNEKSEASNCIIS